MPFAITIADPTSRVREQRVLVGSLVIMIGLPVGKTAIFVRNLATSRVMFLLHRIYHVGSMTRTIQIL